MKKTFVAGLLLASLLTGFSAEQRIATIDLRKAFDNYWRTKQADANLKEQANDLKKESDAMVGDFQKRQESYRKTLDGANDPALSAEERDRRKKQAEDDLLSLRAQEERIRQFDNTSKTTLIEKQRRVRDQILSEIKEKVKAKAKAGNYTMVLDTAAESINNTPFLLYNAATDNDLTDAVLAELNINAPKDAPKASAPSEPGK
jgi:outer membrane protein